MEHRLEDLVHERVREFHAQAGEGGQDKGAFPDDDVLAIAPGAAEAHPGEGDGEGHQEDVLADLGVAELDFRHLGKHVDDLVAREDPSLADDLEADAHGRKEDRNEDQDDLHQVGGDFDILEDPDAGVAEVTEYEGGEQLQEIMDIQHLASHDHLRGDEQDVHHPGERAEGDGGPFEVEDGGRAGHGSGAQVGFQGKRDAEGDQDQAQGGDEVADGDIVLSHKKTRQRTTKMHNYAYICKLASFWMYIIQTI